MLFVLGALLLFFPNLLHYSTHDLAVSDRASGALVLVLAIGAALTGRPWVSWLAGVVGFWILLAPIALWAPSLGAYVGGSLIGTLVVFEGLVLPMSWTMRGDEIPAGWSYNPSSWSQRLPVIVLAIASALIAGYLAAYQLGAIETIWDPVFGRGTERVLTSDVSRAWPISDAGLGAAMFVIDLLMTCVGDRRRWRTMPWLVLLFGVMIIPIGAVSIVLVILQPVAVGAWCFWCLLTAATTLAMIPLAIDEVAASILLLRDAKRRGGSWWTVLWRGDHDGGVPVPADRLRAFSMPPWTLGVIALAGGWLMVAPSLLAVPVLFADSQVIAGALLVVVAGVAVAELARPFRFLACPLAAWIAFSPWILGTSSRMAWSNVLLAIIVFVAAFPRGTTAHRHGAADRLVA